MVSLLAEFSRAETCTTYLSAVRQCLDPASRTQIHSYDPERGDGAALLKDLRQIVDLRNRQAEFYQRAKLPEPLSEIRRLQASGVPL